jgi:hypothetical protein
MLSSLRSAQIYHPHRRQHRTIVRLDVPLHDQTIQDLNTVPVLGSPGPEMVNVRPFSGLCSGGVGSPARPLARPSDRPETCENHKDTTKIIGKLTKTIKTYQNHRETTQNALARSPVAKHGPVSPAF